MSPLLAIAVDLYNFIIVDCFIVDNYNNIIYNYLIIVASMRAGTRICSSLIYILYMCVERASTRVWL